MRVPVEVCFGWTGRHALAAYCDGCAHLGPARRCGPVTSSAAGLANQLYG
jgi:hypothetical protein